MLGPKRVRILRKVLIWLITLLLVGVGTAFTAFSYSVAAWVTAARHSPPSVNVKVFNATGIVWPVSFPARGEKVQLSGWLLIPSMATHLSLIIVPGWNEDRSSYVGLADEFLAGGFTVLVFDPQGTGLSTGTHQTLGAEESKDVLGAYDFMLKKGYRASGMTILGRSEGAAAVIVASPQLPKVAALVADSSYAELGSVLSEQWNNLTGLPGFTDFLASWFASQNGANPGLDLTKIVAGEPKRAFLFIQANGDSLIPPANAKELKAASQNPATQLLLLNGTYHLDTFAYAPYTYLLAVDNFIGLETKLSPQSWLPFNPNQAKWMAPQGNIITAGKTIGNFAENILGPGDLNRLHNFQ